MKSIQKNKIDDLCDKFLHVLDKLDITDDYVLPTKSLVKYFYEIYEIEVE